MEKELNIEGLVAFCVSILSFISVSQMDSTY